MRKVVTYCLVQLMPPIRKLNTEIPNNDDSNRIMRLGAYILRKYKCSNFNDLSRKWRELTYE